MTTVSQIITDAYRECNLIAISATPTTAEQSEALRLLNRLVLSVLGYELGQQFQPVAIGDNGIESPQGFPWYGNIPAGEWWVPMNHRLIVNQTQANTIDLHPEPQDGARLGVVDASGNLATYNLTLRGNGRTIEGASSVTLSTNSLRRQWFYRADLGDWVVVADLALDDDFPFPEEFDDFFIIMLAMRLNPRHAQQLMPESQAAFTRSRSQFRARYNNKRQMHSEIGLLRLSQQSYPDNSYDEYGFYDTTDKFLRGYPY